ncbi:serine hydrolase-like protein isoform X3 [Toxotes jaculatrix]|uniref:serine hydrolase-like protein isoform X3 n=1 Tax=Toxotes jaculatrix TaxID=941984 RepID=UPI001B3ABC7F|nr:serine hydrolase-like protein isoform X3 [Toxotes jaculatrix]
MVVPCCACTAGLTTVAHSTASFPCCPKSADMWRWTCQVTVGRHIVLLEFSTRFLRMWQMCAESLMVCLQWTKFSIVGHSMGGNVAAMFSALYPEMVDALVLLDAYGFLPADPKEVFKVMKQGMDDMIQFEKKTGERKRVYTYEKAVERLSAANPSLSEQSLHILLERGLVQVEGAGVEFSRDLRINFKNVVRIPLEQSLEMQLRIQASVLVILADKGFGATFPESDHQKRISALLQGYRDRNHTVVTVTGNHHVHLNDPEVVAPLVSDFLRTKVLTQLLPA